VDWDDDLARRHEIETSIASLDAGDRSDNLIAASQSDTIRGYRSLLFIPQQRYEGSLLDWIWVIKPI